MNLSAFDLDYTLLSVNSSYEFGKFLYKKGILTFKTRFYCLRAYTSYHLFKMPLKTLHETVFVTLLKGREVATFEDEVEPFLDAYFEKMLFEPAVSRLKKAQEEGHEILLLSNSPQFLVGPIAERLGITQWSSTYYEIDHEKKISQISLLMEGHCKAELLSKHAIEKNIPIIQVTAYSDSYDDIEFLKSAGKAVGVNPDRRLRRLCLQNGWEII